MAMFHLAKYIYMYGFPQNSIFFSLQGYGRLFIHKIKHKHILAKNYFSQIPVLASLILEDSEVEDIRSKYCTDKPPKIIEARGTVLQGASGIPTVMSILFSTKRVIQRSYNMKTTLMFPLVFVLFCAHEPLLGGQY